MSRRFEAAHARRQYDAVDPDNRLVAGELERRWNERLKEERRLQDELDAISAAPSHGVTPDEREALLRLGADVERAWHAEGATIATRKRIVRMLIEEIVVRVEEDRLDLVIRWAGEDHTALRVRKNRTGEHRWRVDADVVDLVRAMARQMPDMGIAAALNRAGKARPRGIHGRERGWPPFVTITASPSTERANAPSAARQRLTRRRRSSRSVPRPCVA